MNTTKPALDDLLDQLVAEYSDRLARGGPDKGVGEQAPRKPGDAPADGSDLIARVPAEHRDGLQRCFRMLQAGVGTAPRRAGAPVPGDVFGDFRIVSELGRGGMAIVYLAVQQELSRQVALKVLRPGLAVEARHVDRFRREALAVARLQHPHIVAVYAVGESRGFHYIAMEYVDGRSLAEVFDALPQDRPRSAQDLAAASGLPAVAVEGKSFEQAFCALLAPVARALATAHECGLVHRDVKPSNILVHKDGRAVIADFGLVQGDGDPGLSLTGEPLGTPYYMSPEQAAVSSARVDQRTDVYSLGVTLYEGLSGRRPFEGETLLAVLAAVREHQVPPLRGAGSGASRGAPRDLTRDAEAVTRRAMERRPEDRYATSLEFAADLLALADGRGTQAALREGGATRRQARLLRALIRGEITEYRSSAQLFGWPLVHFVGRVPGRRSKLASGWVAVGCRAVGVVAVGNRALGVLALGGASAGIVSLGGLAFGVLPLGGIAAGWMAVGGGAVGFGAVGGAACGYYAMGGGAWGMHLITNAVQDPAALEWFRPWLDWITLVPGMEVLQRFF